MPKLEPSLQHLLAQLERLNAPVVPLLQPGLSLPQIQTRLAEVPLRPPAEVYTLFQWRNGVPADQVDRHLLFPDGAFFSLEAAVQEYSQQIAVARQAAAQAQAAMDEIWRAEWLPLFGAAEGDLYVVLCDRREKSRAPILLVDYETRTAVQIYDHLAGMIAAAAECYQRGAHTVEQGVARCTDQNQAAQIARRHNPRSAHWLMLEAGGAQSVGDLVRAIHSPDASLREKAAQALLVLRDRRAVSGLIESMGGAAPAARALAARLLGTLGDTTAADPLIERLRDEDAGVRSAAAQALGELRVQAALALINILHDQDQTVRVKAIWALGELAAPQAVEPLIAMLSHESVALRLEAAKALGMIGDRHAAEALLHATQDSFPDVRQMAAWAMEKLR